MFVLRRAQFEQMNGVEVRRLVKQIGALTVIGDEDESGGCHVEAADGEETGGEQVLVHGE